MLLRLIVALVLIFLLYRAGRWLVSYLNQKNISPPGKIPPIAREDLVEDPNCKTYIPLSSAIREEVDGKILYFCGRQCRDEYRQKEH